MKGNDVLFGDAQDNSLVGGWGDDWISGGTGDDGLLGDDGRIFVSRNSTVFGEPLYGIAPIAAADINKLISVANGNLIAIVNVSGQLKYTADLTPQNLDPSVASPNVLFQPLHVDDMLYGGLGDDSIHAGAGDDAISGAEAPVAAVTNNYDHDGAKLNGAPLVSDFADPLNPGNVLGYSPATPADLDPETKFALYDADDVVRKILLTATGALSKTGSGNEWFSTSTTLKVPSIPTGSPGNRPMSASPQTAMITSLPTWGTTGSSAAPAATRRTTAGATTWSTSMTCSPPTAT